MDRGKSAYLPVPIHRTLYVKHYISLLLLHFAACIPLEDSVREKEGAKAQRKGKRRGGKKKNRRGSSYSLQSLFSSLNELWSTGACLPQAEISSNRESDRYRTLSPNEADSQNSA